MLNCHFDHGVAETKGKCEYQQIVGAGLACSASRFSVLGNLRKIARTVFDPQT